MKIAIYPGSFDPITNGHLDIVERASQLFDRIHVAIALNSSKTPHFDTQTRVEMVKDATAHLDNVEVHHFEGLLVEYAKTCKAQVVIRGLRAISDFEYEFQMALMNRELHPALETTFLMPRQEYIYLSSRTVKEVAQLGGDIRPFVPKIVAEKLG